MLRAEETPSIMDPTTPTTTPDRLTAAPGFESRPGPLDLFLTATWLGLVTGFVELGLMLTRNHAFGTAALGAVPMNRHCLWMIPVADLLILAGAGLVLSLGARSWPQTASRAAAYGL